MKVILKEGFIYTPNWNDNKKEKKEDQIRIHFKFLSGEDFSNAITAEGKIDLLQDWLIICTKIENLLINEIEITPEGLYKQSGLADLYLEAKGAYRNETVIDKKK